VKDASLATKYQTTSNIEGFTLNGGFHYKGKVNDKMNFLLGGNFDFNNSSQ